MHADGQWKLDITTTGSLLTYWKKTWIIMKMNPARIICLNTKISEEVIIINKKIHLEKGIIYLINNIKK